MGEGPERAEVCMRHAAKVDWFIGVSILGGILVPLLGHTYWASGLVLGILLIAVYPQCYETTPQGLVIRSGVTSRLVPYEAITFVGPSSNARSSVALSLDRVKVQWGPSSEVLIAPADPERFAADIASHAPHLTRRGQDLVPRGADTPACRI